MTPASCTSNRATGSPDLLKMHCERTLDTPPAPAEPAAPDAAGSLNAPPRPEEPLDTGVVVVTSPHAQARSTARKAVLDATGARWASVWRGVRPFRIGCDF